MGKKPMMLGVIAFFLIGAVAGNYIVKLWRQAPESTETTRSLIGTPIPNFSLLALDGVREHSDQWLGKVLVINFWATWCPPCKREMPTLVELQNEYRNQGLQIVGIAVDEVEAVEEYLRENTINYPILVGHDDVIEVGESLGNDQGFLPYTLITDQAGNIAFIKYGEVDREMLENEIKPLL